MQASWAQARPSWGHLGSKLGVLGGIFGGHGQKPDPCGYFDLGAHLDLGTYLDFGAFWDLGAHLLPF